MRPILRGLLSVALAAMSSLSWGGVSAFFQYEWTIDKVADQSNLLLAPGQTFTVNYEIILNVSVIGVASDSDIDECVDVSDSLRGSIGIVCPFVAPSTFTIPYSLVFGSDPGVDVLLQLGDNSIDNTASFVTNDTGTVGTASHTVQATVIPAQSVPEPASLAILGLGLSALRFARRAKRTA